MRATRQASSRFFVLRILLPTLLALVLFGGTIWGLLLPAFEQTLLDRKRELIRELTSSAWSILVSYEREERAGTLSRVEAQELAKAQIASLRYGPQGKDYFWLQDLHPRIVMHPYRPDLNGQDVSAFTDPRGARIFVEFAELVRRSHEGYIAYYWQWHDDPQRIGPKESYVKGFAPWGWVIGTGVYREDVQQEIARLEGDLVMALLVVSGVVVALLAFVVQQSLRIEQGRRQSEEGLRESTERYRALVEATTESTLLVLGTRCCYANPVLLKLLGYRMDELERLALAEILPDDVPNAALWEHLRRRGREPGPLDRLPGALRRADGQRVACAITLNPIAFDGIAGFILLAQPQELVPPARREAERDAMLEQLQTSLLFLHEPVGPLAHAALRCDLTLSLQQVAELMTRHKATAALLEAEGGLVVGIVTDHDLRARALAEGRAVDALAHTVMSAPLLTISEHALIYEALLRMEEKGVRHLAVIDESGQISGLVQNSELIQFQRYGATVLTREIARAASAAAVARCCARTPGLINAVLDVGARPRATTHMLSSICDAATQRLLALAIDELGPPPAPFAFIALGSHGRQEQTLLTDQDNALLFATPADPEAQRQATDYFLRLGANVCAGLAQAGYALCKGQVMASNPRWCCSLEDWKTTFSAWITTAEPQQLLEFSIFFDFRTVFGAPELAHELRRHILAMIDGQPGFCAYLAQQALQFTPPTRLFGSLYLGGSGLEHVGQLNVKDVLLPIVSFARLYALHHAIPQTNTLDRIAALTAHGVLLPTTRDEIVAAYDFLLGLRLRGQLEGFLRAQPVAHSIDLRKLRHSEEALLRQTFAQIAALQKKISHDFLGGAL